MREKPVKEILNCAIADVVDGAEQKTIFSIVALYIGVLTKKEILVMFGSVPRMPFELLDRLQWPITCEQY